MWKVDRNKNVDCKTCELKDYCFKENNRDACTVVKNKLLKNFKWGIIYNYELKKLKGRRF